MFISGFYCFVSNCKVNYISSGITNAAQQRVVVQAVLQMLLNRGIQFRIIRENRQIYGNWQDHSIY
jgi:hypothetical protein